jgi:hypothetical protein
MGRSLTSRDGPSLVVMRSRCAMKSNSISKVRAPSGIELHVQQALPAGVQVDRPSLEALIEAGTITRFVIADGKVDLHVAPLAPGATFTAKYRVIPTLAGKLQSAASLVEAGPTKYFVPPTIWTIK